VGSNVQVEVCCFRVPQEGAALEHLSRLLTADERERVTAVVHGAERARRIAGRGLLRVLLGHRLGVDPARLGFSVGARGKPRLILPAGRGLEFNLSHSGDYLAIAWAEAGAIGIDIECPRPVRDTVALVERFFSHEEREAFNSVSEQDRECVFRRLWTGKEAVLKAVGCGIAGGLEACAVDVSGPAPKLLRISEHLGMSGPLDWWLWSLRMPEGYQGTLACYAPAVQWHLVQRLVEEREWAAWLDQGR